MCQAQIVKLRDGYQDLNQKVKQLPYFVLKLSAIIGDLLKRIGFKNPPITTFRLNNLVTSMYFNTLEVEKIVGKNGVDVVYDGVGIKTFDGSIETLKVRGMMVAFGNASGYVDTIDVKKHINAKGLFFTRPSIAHYTMTRKELVESAKKVFDAILSGKFKVEISKKYSLDDAKKAHEELEARLLTGPAVIIPN